MSQNNENENTSVSEQAVETQEANTAEAPESGESVSVEESSATEARGEVKQDSGFMQKLRKFGKAAWAYIKHARKELIVLIAVLIADLVSKAIINACMDVGQSVQLIPDFLRITYVHNKMAAFGSAFGLEKVLSPEAIRIIFLIITVIAMGIFAYILYRCRRRHILMRVSLALILAGALGNFVDRLFIGYVRDFVEIVFFGCDLPLLGTSFAIFNIADAGLTVGVIVFLIYFIVYFKDPKPTDSKTVHPNTHAYSDRSAEDSQSDAAANAAQPAESATITTQDGDATGADTEEDK